MRIVVINRTAGGMSGGYRKYLLNVIPRMAKHCDVESILCASPDSIDVQDWFDSISNVKFVRCKPFRPLFPHRDDELLRELEEFAPDVIFVPIERSFSFNNVPVVSMVQNMEPFAQVNEENFLFERFKNLLHSFSSKRAVKKASRIIAISEFIKEFLTVRWRIPEVKIRLVYYGNTVLTENNDIRPSAVPLNWEKRFIFTAGSIRPARGIEDILKAVGYLKREMKEGVNLVIAGETSKQMMRYEKRLKAWLKQKELSDNVCWIGGLSEPEMNWCYKNCSVFIMTSRVESFGLIALEAMTHGAICIAADNPCLPEIFTDGAVYYSPKKPDVLVQKIQEVLGWGLSQKDEMVKKAKKRADDFSWEVTVEKTLDVFNEVIEEFKNQRMAR